MKILARNNKYFSDISEYNESTEDFRVSAEYLIKVAFQCLFVEKKLNGELICLLNGCNECNSEKCPLWWSEC